MKNPPKIKVPYVPLQSWNDLYSLAKTMYTLRPWNELSDLDLIGMRDPSTGESGYGVFMGSEGTLFGFCLYRGSDGFHIYKRLMERPHDPDVQDFFSIQDTLLLEYVTRAELQPEDAAVIRSLNLTFKEKRSFPQFRSLRPGFLPWYFTETEAEFFIFSLSVAILHHQRIISGEVNESIREGQCLMYIPNDSSRRKVSAQWEPWPVLARMKITPPILNLQRISALRVKKTESDTPWEVDQFYVPATIMDNERPYFLRSAVVCHQSTGTVYHLDAAMPEQPVPQFLADAVCSAIEKHGMLPDTIFVKSADIAAALSPLANALGFTVRARKNLRAVNMLKKAMTDDILRGGLQRKR